MRRRFVFKGLMILSCLAGCVPAPVSTEATREMTFKIQNPNAPQTDDSALIKGKAYVESIAWDEAARTLSISGELPTPCHQLRVNPALSAHVLELEVYSLSDPASMCTQVLEPFKTSLILENFSKSDYSILINGEEAQF